MATCFNPRARAGRDVPWSGWDNSYRVSIHAPVRGATVSTDPSEEVQGYEA